MAEKKPFTLQLTNDVLNVLNAARGAALTENELEAIATGQISAPPIVIETIFT